MRFSYQLLPEQPLDELLGTLELLDQLGFWACYSAEETYHSGLLQGGARLHGRRVSPRRGER